MEFTKEQLSNVQVEYNFDRGDPTFRTPDGNVWINPLAQPLYQVFVEEVKTNKLIPVGPRMIQDACGELCAAINKMVHAGKEKEWANANLVPVLNLDMNTRRKRAGQSPRN